MAPALLLVNLGTPRSADVADVRAFLGEFLGDPRVVGGPTILRRLLVEGLIVPLRGPRSAHAYRRVWTESGSPILAHGRTLAEKLRERMPGRAVELAMRYGEPGLAEALERIVAAGARAVTVLPLFPQYADSTTGSAVARLEDIAAGRVRLDVVPDFFDHPAFVAAQSDPLGEIVARVRPDHVLFSYHGVPESHLLREDSSGSRCLWSADCCAAIGDVNRFCYRAQCRATSAALMAALDPALLPEGLRVHTTFQSRFGPMRWARPYTDRTIERLAEEGARRIVVACPAFAADCLETIEEIGMTERARFIAAGGEDLWRVPCVNASDRWADGVVAIVRDHEEGRRPLLAELRARRGRATRDASAPGA